MHRHNHGCDGLHAAGRRGFKGFPGMGKFGDFDGMGDGFRIGRMLAGGDLRLVALYLIEEQPRHGYDLIKAIEERTSGFYSPSPGVIYPALTFLEEAGYTTANMDGNKKAYAITDEGKAHLEDNRPGVEAALKHLGHIGQRMSAIRERMAGDHAPADRDIPNVLPAVNTARRALKAAIAEAIKGDEDDQHRLAEILMRAAEDIQKGQVDL